MSCLRLDEYKNSRYFHSYLDFKKAKDLKDRRLLISLPRFTVEISQCPKLSFGYLMFLPSVTMSASMSVSFWIQCNGNAKSEHDA